MDNTNELLDAAKRATGLESDRQLAKAIGVSPQALNSWRKGDSHPDSFAVVQIAKILNRSPLEILGIVEAGKAKTEERKEYWQDFLTGLLDTTKKLGVIGAITYASFTTTAGEALTKTPPLTTNLTVCECILCKIRRLVRSLVVSPI